MRNEQWIIYENLSLVRLKIFEWIKFLEDIYINFRETELVEIS